MEARVEEGTRVTVIGFDIPFMSMLVGMLQWALASVPAMVVLAVGYLLAIFIVGGAMQVLQ